ncbi:MAG: hypothetical protein PHO01_03420 [Desulfotomaculaceae bacterium]|nr:hypothetical protein [Desulfotomaculaceae bacterium]
MDCRKALLLILLHQDGVISSTEQEVLKEHVDSCMSCAQELALQQRLSRVLQKMRQEELQAPPELCGMIMNRIRAEHKSVFAWLPAEWRKAIAAAAAILLFAGGAAGVNMGLNIPGGNGSNNVAITTETDLPNKADSNDKIGPDSSNQTTGRNDAHEETTETVIGTTNGNNIDVPNGIPENNEATENSESADVINRSIAAHGNNNNNPSNFVDLTSQDSTNVLLSKRMQVTSTILKLAVDDLTDARARAVSIAASADASTQVFPEQNGNKKIVVLRLTADLDRAEDLLAGLARLGEKIEMQDESRDITSFYNNTELQYNDLLSKINTSTNTEERRQMEAQATSYKQQLENMNMEAGKRVIMLWLEGS